MTYSVNIWACKPFEDDLCITGKDFDNMKDAHEAYSQPFAHFKHLDNEPVLWAEYAEDGETKGQRCIRKLDIPKGCDDDWKREIAMQAGMGLGIDAYNDAMGWGSK